MVGGFEVSTNGVIIFVFGCCEAGFRFQLLFRRSGRSYVVEVYHKSVFQFILCLPDILFVASGADKTIDQVVALAGYLSHGVVRSASGSADDIASLVKTGAVSAV